MMVDLTIVISIASLIMSIASLSLSLIAILKIMASERATHTIYNQGSTENTPPPINTEELFPDSSNPEPEFAESTTIENLEKNLLGDFD